MDNLFFRVNVLSLLLLLICFLVVFYTTHSHSVECFHCTNLIIMHQPAHSGSIKVAFTTSEKPHVTGIYSATQTEWVKGNNMAIQCDNGGAWMRLYVDGCHTHTHSHRLLSLIASCYSPLKRKTSLPCFCASLHLNLTEMSPCEIRTEHQVPSLLLIQTFTFSNCYCITVPPCGHFAFSYFLCFKKSLCTLKFKISETLSLKWIEYVT